MKHPTALPLALLALSSLASTTASPPSSHLETVLDRGRLSMACFPGMESAYVRPKLDVLRERGVPLAELRDGDAYEGSDVELVRGFADFLGVELEILPVTTSYGDVVAAVAERRADLAASSLTVTDEREKIVDFSQALESIWAVVATPLDGPMLSLEELAGKKIRGMRGSSQVEIFRRMGPPDAEIVPGDYTLENYIAVTEGGVRFMLMDSKAEVGEPASDVYPEVKVMIRLAETRYAVAFPEGSDLRERFNEYLARR